MSFIYNVDGDIKELNLKASNGDSFFRKQIVLNNSYLKGNRNELDICRLIQSTASSQLLRIYQVENIGFFKNIYRTILRLNNHDDRSYSFVDEEILDTEYSYDDFFEKGGVSDLRKNLDEFHRLGIIYIDFKRDNVGFSKKDNCFKFFDFDFSALINPEDPTKFINPPNTGYNLRDALRKSKNITFSNFIELDNYLFEKFLKDMNLDEENLSSNSHSNE